MQTNDLQLRSVNQLLKESFYIPAYQRGYRWTVRQVTDLLEDVLAFIKEGRHAKGEFYCLQPVVIAQHGQRWELIDGQQRLTTIFLVLSYFNNRRTPEFRTDLFSLAYETRERSAEYLRTLNAEERDSNIDFFHIWMAYQAIIDWFKDRAEFVNDVESAFLRSVKVIWYEVRGDVDPIAVFTRLNIGKIPLTNAELVKALFLRASNFEREEQRTRHLQQLKIAQEWDEIERRLQDDAFWFFLGSLSQEAQLVQPLCASVSSFIDENIEREDVGDRWNRKVKALDIEGWLKRQQTAILDELRGRLVEFSREMSVESNLIGEFDAAKPSQFDPWDVKRSLRWVSATGGALAGVAAVAGYFGAANIWNPVGWIAGGVSVIALGLSWLFGDRESKLQGQKARATAQLRESIDKLEQEVANGLKKWFYDSVTSRLVRAIRKDTKQLCNGMRDVSRSLDEGARQVGAIVEGLNRRLLVRAGQFVGASVDEASVSRVVRDPGVRAKFLWRDGNDNPAFCRQVGLAIGEWVDGIPEGSVAHKVAWSLRPASVAPAMVSITAQTAVVRVPQSEVGRAIGRRGSNVSLASRLVGIRINVISEESRTHD